ncbi:MAG: formylglycine-generating enzyme family protein, partial [Proteobacteria bacterium]|nr:formylglycine-generating enzyme family protein [Pseudomonadota bacterium]
MLDIRRHGLCFAALLLLAPATITLGAEPRAPLPGGEFVPVMRPAPAPAPASVRIAPFELDRVPVSNADFLLFVRSHPEWRRDRVPALLA